MSSETDWSLNFFDWFKMLLKVLKWTLKNLNQEVLGYLQKFAKAQIKRLYVYSIAYYRIIGRFLPSKVPESNPMGNT